MITGAPKITITSSPETYTVPLFRSQIPGAPAGDPLANLPAPETQYIIEGTHTLSGVYQIVAASGAVEKMKLVFFYRATLTTDTADGKAFSIFGYKFTDAQALKDATVECYFNGTSWEVAYNPDFEESGIIAEKHYAANSIPETAFKASSIPGTAIKDGAISREKFTLRAVGEDQLDNQSVSANKLKDNAVSTVKIQNSSVTNEKLNSMEPGAVKVGGADFRPVDKQMNIAPGALLFAQGYGKAPEPKEVFMEGSFTKDGAFYITPGAVTTPKLGTYAVTPEKADDTMVSELIPVLVDFADASRNRVLMAFKGAVFTIWASVEKDIVGNGTITIKDDNDVVVAVIDTNDGDPKDTTAYAVNPIAGTGTFDKLDTYKFECAGSSAGKVLLSVICYKRS